MRKYLLSAALIIGVASMYAQQPVKSKDMKKETGVHQELVANKKAYYNLVKNQLELGK